MWKRKGHTLSHINWREQIELHSVEEDWVDAWLAEGEEESGARAVSRVQTPMPNFQRHDARRVAAVRQNNWDTEVSGIKNHVAGILGKLGNGR